MSLAHCHNVEDFRRLAKRRLPAPLFHYLDGGADDEGTLRRSSAAFDDYELLPRVLSDVSGIDLRTRVLGCELAMPLFMAPTGMSRLFHHAREPAVARAAAEAGTLYSLSTMATTTIEDVGNIPGPKMFQIYIFKDRGLTREFVQRCKAAGYAALCLTVDTPVAGNRERDRRTGMVMPPRFGLGSLLSFCASPYWSFHYLLQPGFTLANVAHRVRAGSGGGSAMGVIEFVNTQFDRSVGWDDVAWLAQEWGGPLAIKGVLAPDDARRCREVGASAVMISSHGGRQLDGVPAPIDCLAPMRDAVGDELELIVDGGIRRGTDVLKALALGADACSIGRPCLYGLAAGGEAGVARVLQLFSEELQRGMALLGCSQVSALSSRHLQHRSRSTAGEPTWAKHVSA